MKIGVYICHCGTNIAATVDVEEVAKFAETLPDVAVSRAYVYMCSDPGQELIKKDIRDAKLDRVVVASCSPRMHEVTFRRACEEAGLNAYCLEMANIREQCSWVHSDREKGTEKAKELVASAVAKASLLESLEPMRVGVTPSALIIGGGIAGIQCALDIADAGFQVYLVEKEPSVGGHMAQLDKTFPTLDCSACVLTPKMVDVARHDKIKLITYAAVDSVEGYVGNFKVKVKKTPRYVDEDKCTGCGECANICPIKDAVPNDFDLGLSKRGAVYIPFPQAIPMVYTIDKMGGIPPCRLGCPANVNVQGYVALIAQGRYREAIDLIREVNPLPAICGYVCPHPCEEECNRGEIDDPIAIAALKRFAADNIDYDAETDDETEEADETKDATKEERAEKIAIIGSGPAGLTAAFYLAKSGYQVRIVEKLPVPGGMLAVGIPEYRLPRDILKKEVEYIKREGGEIEIETGVEIDKDGFEKLNRDYNAIFVSIGADKSRALGIEGENLKGVVHGVDFLRELNLGNTVELGKKVAVVGGGDVAIDAARCALRLGSDVTIVYRRSREEMPARDEEIEDAEAEGVKIIYLTNPSRIIGDDIVQGMECVRMELGEPDESGRRRPVPVEGSEFILAEDTVILAVGQQSALGFLEGSGIEIDGNWIKVDGHGRTNIECVFAAGDAVTGPATVIDAIAGGKSAAEAIDRYLRGEPLPELDSKEKKRIELEDIKARLPELEKNERRKVAKVPAERRRNSFEVVELGFTETDAIEEAKRCMKCGICADCRLCETVCEADAIFHEMEEELEEIEVGAIIAATGYDLFDPSLEPNYGYEYDEVITSMEFERLCNASGPTTGHIEINGKTPKEVVFISCVGSREGGKGQKAKGIGGQKAKGIGQRERGEMAGNEYCSRVCCMYIAKQAHLVREHIPDANATVFYTDVRAFGKGFEEFYWRVKEEGVNYIRRELTDELKVDKDENGQLRVKTVSEGVPIEKEADLVVLATGIVPKDDVRETARKLKITQSGDKFFLEAHPKLRPVDTLTDGIFIAGCCQSPKDIPDTVAQASATASRACSILCKEYVEVEPITAEVDETLCCGCAICESVCPYGAIEVVDTEEGRRARVTSVKCHGCGTCGSSCIKKAVKMHQFTDEQLIAQERAALATEEVVF